MEAVLLGLTVCALLSGGRAGHHPTNRPAVARFDMNGIRGHVIFHVNATALQLSCNLTGITDSDVMMEIRKFPLFPGQSASPCDRLGSAFNPTRDATALGSLSRRLNFTVKNGEHDLYDPSTLKLVGDTGIVGRSLALTKNKVAIACANIALVKNAGMRQCGSKNNENRHETFRATFRGRVSGTVMIRRLKDAPTKDATLYSHLYYADNTAVSTTNHSFKIHQKAVGEACWPCTEAQIGSVEQAVLGALSIGKSPSAVEAKQVISVQAPPSFAALSKKTLAIYDTNNMTLIIACADISILAPKKFVADFGDHKTVSIEQMSPFDSTSIEMNVGDGVKSVSINQYPVPANGKCKSSSTGLKFNPFQKQQPDTKGMTPDKYPVGDLTNKLGHYLGRGHVCDDSLPLFGAQNVGGRSVTILYHDGQTMCANLVKAYTTGQRLIKAKATFRDQQGGNVVGTIYIQQYKYGDGSLGETTINSAGLRNSDGKVTFDHNYHVHIGRKGFQRDVAACGNSYAKGHYNPRPVNVAVKNSPYKTDCSAEDQMRCELGDTSRKSGQLSLNGSRIYRHDSFLPLNGQFTVLGRSFVIHVANGGAPRYACANIIPEMAQDIQIGFKKSQLNGRNFNKTEFEQHVSTVASSSSLTASTLYTSRNGEDAESGCMYVSAAIDGKDAEAVANKLYSADLGPYTQDSACISFAQSTGSPASSVTVSVVSLILSIAFTFFIQ